MVFGVVLCCELFRHKVMALVFNYLSYIDWIVGGEEFTSYGKSCEPLWQHLLPFQIVRTRVNEEASLNLTFFATLSLKIWVCERICREACLNDDELSLYWSLCILCHQSTWNFWIAHTFTPQLFCCFHFCSISFWLEND